MQRVGSSGLGAIGRSSRDAVYVKRLLINVMWRKYEVALGDWAGWGMGCGVCWGISACLRMCVIATEMCPWSATLVRGAGLQNFVLLVMKDLVVGHLVGHVCVWLLRWLQP